MRSNIASAVSAQSYGAPRLWADLKGLYANSSVSSKIQTTMHNRNNNTNNKNRNDKSNPILLRSGEGLAPTRGGILRHYPTSPFEHPSDDGRFSRSLPPSCLISSCVLSMSIPGVPSPGVKPRSYRCFFFRHV